MSYLADISVWLQPWGPIGWGAAGLATFLVLLSVLTLIRMGSAWVRSKHEIASYSEKQRSSISVNPIDDLFERKRFLVSEFYHPFLEENTGKVFRECEIMGPGNVLLTGHTDMPRPKFRQCEFVVVDPKKPMYSVVCFKDSSFVDCSFYRVSFFVTAEMVRELKKQVIYTGTYIGDKPLHVVSDGKFGEI